MTSRPQMPAVFDDNPELDDDFFATARPALDNPEIARVLATHSLKYREALKAIVTAHDAGLPIDDVLKDVKAFLAAE